MCSIQSVCMYMYRTEVLYVVHTCATNCNVRIVLSLSTNKNPSRVGKEARGKRAAPLAAHRLEPASTRAAWEESDGSQAISPPCYTLPS